MAVQIRPSNEPSTDNPYASAGVINPYVKWSTSATAVTPSTGDLTATTARRHHPELRLRDLHAEGGQPVTRGNSAQDGHPA
jgi:hypothetical protein